MNVTAVVVASDAKYLSHTLRALATQTALPDRIIVVNVGEATEAPEDSRTVDELLAHYDAQLDVEKVEAPAAQNFGQAISAALSQEPADLAGWLWLLHDDSPPAPDALAELVKATGSARAVGIAGCKQVDFTNPDRLISVGVRYTRSGRRLAEIDVGEIDQGQYDDREDMYAVGTAGMLIRRRTWVATGGIDPVLGPFADGADISRRVRLLGERVIVVPTAQIQHARASLWGLRHGEERDARSSFFARRLAILHSRLTAAPLWRVIFTFLAMLVAAPVRAFWRISTNELRLALAELRAPLAAIARLGPVARSRRRFARTATVGRGTLDPLYATGSEVWRLWWHRWRQAAVESRRRQAPSELEIAEWRALALRRRGTFVAVLLLAFGAGALVLLHAFNGGIGPALSGGSLAGLDEPFGLLWQRAWSAWLPIGDGHPGPVHPFTLVLAVLATPGGWLGLAPPVSVKLVLALAIPLSAVTGWFGAGALTRSLMLRAWAGLAWAFAPALAWTLSEGLLPFVIAHILLPLFALGLSRSFGANQRDVISSGLVGASRVETGAGTDAAMAPAPEISAPSRRSGSLGAAAASGLLLATIAASAPILLPALLLMMVVSALMVRRGRSRLVIVGLPTLVAFAPTLFHAVTAGSWRDIFIHGGTQEGWSGSSGPVVEAVANAPWHVLAGWPREPSVLFLAGGAGILLVALFGLLRGGRNATAARLGWFTIALGAATAGIAAAIVIGHIDDDSGGLTALRGLPAPGTSLVMAGVILAALGALNGLRGWLRRYSFGPRHVLSVMGAALLVAGMGVGGVHTWSAEPVWQPREIDPAPALAREMMASSDRSRVLMLAPTSNAIGAQVWRSNGVQFADSQASGFSWRYTSDQATDELSALVAQMWGGTATDAAQGLAQHAIGVILIPSVSSTGSLLNVEPIDAEAREELSAALDSIARLERVTENESGTLWRVAVPSARVVIGSGQERIAVPSELITVDVAVPDVAVELDKPSSLVLSERADPRWRATLEGESLRSIDTGWRQGFELPAHPEGQLHVWYQPAAHRVWQLALVTVFGLSAVLAIPARSRRRWEVS